MFQYELDLTFWKPWVVNGPTLQATYPSHSGPLATANAVDVPVAIEAPQSPAESARAVNTRRARPAASSRVGAAAVRLMRDICLAPRLIVDRYRYDAAFGVTD